MEILQDQQMEPKGQNENEKSNYSASTSDESNGLLGIPDESEKDDTDTSDQDEEISSGMNCMTTEYI
ncbi:hypothetical protein [Pedobacter sp. JY14-1]|uniref:hypothetical protein n=1 Tax=Pedobacter sp. JY14-1 TaxID=3034151 RepID=UPI0023E1F591|nr:hypothetical protein [Pedobacter sp. JY14-1]